MCGMTPSFTEDFSDFKVTSRDLGTNANWIAHTPWNGDFGDARFTDPGPGGPFATDHAMLHITARKTSGGWQSGLIAAGDGAGHGHGERYGYFEARMKLPPGPGTWPAFWLASLPPARRQTPDDRARRYRILRPIARDIPRHHARVDARQGDRNNTMAPPSSSAPKRWSPNFTTTASKSPRKPSAITSTVCWSGKARRPGTMSSP